MQDGSGEIDLDELRTVMTSLGYSPTDKQLQDMMAKVGQVVVNHLQRQPFDGRRCGIQASISCTIYCKGKPKLILSAVRY